MVQVTTIMNALSLSRREDPSDAVVIKKTLSSSHSSLDSLPSEAKIGTSSVRRVAQLKAKYPHLEIVDVRGNLNTRLKKLDCTDGEYKIDYSALILAAAGVKRMGWEDRISQASTYHPIFRTYYLYISVPFSSFLLPIVCMLLVKELWLLKLAKTTRKFSSTSGFFSTEKPP